MGLNPMVLIYSSAIDVAENGILQLSTGPSWQLRISTGGLNPRNTALGILSKIARAS